MDFSKITTPEAKRKGLQTLMKLAKQAEKEGNAHAQADALMAHDKLSEYDPTKMKAESKPDRIITKERGKSKGYTDTSKKLKRGKGMTEVTSDKWISKTKEAAERIGKRMRGEAIEEGVKKVGKQTAKGFGKRALGYLGGPIAAGLMEAFDAPEAQAAFPEEEMKKREEYNRRMRALKALQERNK